MNNANQSQVRSFRSVDGGASWRATVLVSSVSRHTVAGGLRTSPLPSAEIDAASGTVHHFIAGIGIDRSTSGSAARVGLTYYYYPTAACTSSTCRLNVGFISSTNGGASWGTAANLAGPMPLTWLANTSQGRMVGLHLHLGTSRRQRLADDRSRQHARRQHLQRGDVRPNWWSGDQRRHPPGNQSRRRRHRTDRGRQTGTGRQSPPAMTVAAPGAFIPGAVPEPGWRGPTQSTGPMVNPRDIRMRPG
ncbi:MAG TPA: hypothetical protein VJ966_19645 [Actinomycetes bacterium]|nr:hypothetical protein [Actinomycetes bacterium]